MIAVDRRRIKVINYSIIRSYCDQRNDNVKCIINGPKDSGTFAAGISSRFVCGSNSMSMPMSNVNFCFNVDVWTGCSINNYRVYLARAGNYQFVQ